MFSKTVDSGLGRDNAVGMLLAFYSVLIVFAVCTELRWPGLPVGPAECGLVVLGLGILVSFHDRIVLTLLRYRVLVAFWGGLLVIMAAGALMSWQAGRLSTGWLHDLLALLFAFGTTFILLLLVADSTARVRAVGRAIVGAALAVSLLGFLLLLLDHVLQTRSFSSALAANSFWPGRFNAWAADPNQWAFLLLVAVMLIALLTQYSRATLPVLMVTIWLLLEVRSDAALAGLAVFVAAFALLTVWRAPQRRRMALGLLIIACSLPVAFKFLTATYPPSPVLRVVGALAGVAPDARMLRKGEHLRSMGTLYIGQGPNKLEQRMLLWRHSLEAWWHSPLVGLGPGAYSGVERPFQNVESHNLFVQILVNSGLAGVLAGVSLIAWLLIRLWPNPEGVLWIAALLGVLAQGMGQYMMRHPVFWVLVGLTVWQALRASEPGADAQNDRW